MPTEAAIAGSPPDIALPTADQEVLLRACLGSGERALDAWREWSSRVVLDDIDNGSQRLVPLLYRNLVRLGVGQTEIGRYQGIYRKAWYENQLHLRDLRRVLAAMAAAGVECMVLKGIPLAVSYYEEIALRPMADLDILVHPSAATAAARALTDLGYSPAIDTAADLPVDFVNSINAANFVADSRSDVDVHWRVFLDYWREDAEASFWEASETAQAGDTKFRTMNASDLLLHACVHGIAWNPTPPMRWVADAAMILRARGSDFDWKLASSRARVLGLALPFREALAYLETVIPDELTGVAYRAEVRALRSTRRERLHHRLAVSSPAKLWVAEPLWYYYVRHFGPQSSSDGWWAAIRRFPRFLQVGWGLGRLRDVPRTALRKLWRRLRSVPGK